MVKALTTSANRTLSLRRAISEAKTRSVVPFSVAENVSVYLIALSQRQCQDLNDE